MPARDDIDHSPRIYSSTLATLIALFATVGSLAFIAWVVANAHFH